MSARWSQTHTPALDHQDPKRHIHITHIHYTYTLHVHITRTQHVYTHIRQLIALGSDTLVCSPTHQIAISDGHSYSLSLISVEKKGACWRHLVHVTRVIRRTEANLGFAARAWWHSDGERRCLVILLALLLLSLKAERCKSQSMLKSDLSNSSLIRKGVTGVTKDILLRQWRGRRQRQFVTDVCQLDKDSSRQRWEIKLLATNTVTPLPVEYCLAIPQPWNWAAQKPEYAVTWQKVWYDKQLSYPHSEFVLPHTLIRDRLLHPHSSARWIDCEYLSVIRWNTIHNVISRLTTVHRSMPFLNHTKSGQGQSKVVYSERAKSTLVAAFFHWIIEMG